MGGEEEPASLVEDLAPLEEPATSTPNPVDILEAATVATDVGDGLVVTEAAEALARIRGCSVVAALHPDQAAEATVALALALRKPFAVVPCCVYSAEFPRRRLPNGQPVRSYGDLLAY